MTIFRDLFFLLFSILFFLTGCENYNLPLNTYISYVKSRFQDKDSKGEYYTWFVSARGNDNNDGLSAKTPLLTLQKAIESAGIQYNGGKGWKNGASGPLPAVIFISGEIGSAGRANNAAEIIGDKSVYPPFALEGYEAGGTINVSGTNMRALYIDGGAQVSIGGKLTLIGGSANPGNGVLIQGQNSSFTMREGALVSPGSVVYLPVGSTLGIGSDLTGTSYMATITPEVYSGSKTIRILSGTPELIAANYGRFSVTPDKGPYPWHVDREGFLSNTPLYAPFLYSLIPGVAQLDARWSEVPGAASYEVYYGSGPTPDATAPPQVSGITTTSCTLTGLGQNTYYSVWVRARAGLAVSSWSNRLIAITLPKVLNNAEPVHIPDNSSSGESAS
jgi:hypothetical protein